MISMIDSSVIALVAAAMTGGQAAAQPATAPAYPQARPTSAQSPASADSPGSSLYRGEGLIVLDYQVIPVPQQPALDLAGFHILNKVADGLYVGVGAYAPLVKGEYGGFMAFDVGVNAQRRIRGPLFANAGLAPGRRRGRQEHGAKHRTLGNRRFRQSLRGAGHRL